MPFQWPYTEGVGCVYVVCGCIGVHGCIALLRVRLCVLDPYFVFTNTGPCPSGVCTQKVLGVSMSHMGGLMYTTVALLRARLCVPVPCYVLTSTGGENRCSGSFTLGERRFSSQGVFSNDVWARATPYWRIARARRVLCCLLVLRF